MARIRTARITGFLLAVPFAAVLLLTGAGAAQADNGSSADRGSNAGVTTADGSGNVFGRVDGNTNWTQQSATGSGAANENNTLGVKGNSGQVYASQTNLNISFSRPAR
ncbi:hypothetical protein ACIQGZ_02150 [Streptomyces sp. NPDC092296]|uniref:hypothetical protein n=1 Tax=Streptomyces sp. NPDC092296 TaxID=3366012 RepID=UPI0037F24223